MTHRRPESQRPVSVMSLLLVTSALSLLTCVATHSSSFNPKRKSRTKPPLDFRPQYNQIYQVQKLKDKILRGLNLTAEPKPPSKKTPQPIHSVLNRLPPPRNRTNTRSPVPDTIVWSEPVDASEEAADQLLFRVGSQREKSSLINRVTLLLRLRFVRHSKVKGKKGKASGKKRVKNSKESQLPDARDSGMQNDAARKSRRGKKRSSSKKKKKKSGGGSKRKTSRRVKLLVQAVREKTGKFKRVVVQRVTVSKKFTWIKIPIPVSLVSQAAQSANDSLVLRVRCKRCLKIGVFIDNALPRKKKSRKSDLDSGSFPNLNPNRPYMVICTADEPLTTQSPASLPRSARHVDRVCQSQPEVSCCSEEMEVTFEDIGWARWIVYPRGFTTVMCNVCPNSTQNQSVSYSESELLQSGKTPANRENIVLNKQRHDGEMASNNDSDFRPTNWRQPGMCQLKDASSLTVMLHTNHNTLVRAAIPHLIARTCVCSPP